MSGATIGCTLNGSILLLAWRYSFHLFAFAAFAAFIVAVIGLKQVGSSAERKIKKQYEIGAGLSRLLLVSVLLGFTGSVIQPIYLVYLQDEFTTDLGSLAWAFLPIRVLSRSYGAAVEDGQASG